MSFRSLLLFSICLLMLEQLILMSKFQAILSRFGWDMVKAEGTYIQVVYKNVFDHISTDSWLFFMIQRPTIREECAWVRSNTWRDERLVATSLDRFFSVFRFFNKRRNWQLKIFRICATATGGLVFCSWVQFDFGLFSSPANWTCEHYQGGIPGKVQPGGGARNPCRKLNGGVKKPYGHWYLCIGLTLAHLLICIHKLECVRICEKSVNTSCK